MRKSQALRGRRPPGPPIAGSAPAVCLSVRRHSNVHLCTLNAGSTGAIGIHAPGRRAASMLRLFRATQPAINRRQ